MQSLETVIRLTPTVETPIPPTVSASIAGHQQTYEMAGSDEWTFKRTIC